MYTIRPGDTLSGIAGRFHTTVGELARLNHISNPNLIRAGAQLKLQGDHFEPAPQATAASHGNVHGSTRLANAGRQVANEMRSTGWCARGVSRAIERATGIKVWGNGNQIDDNLPKNRFRQVNLTLAQALKIPGLVLTWEHTSSALGSKYGHTAITAGDGHTSYSDHAEAWTSGSGRYGLKVFMPL